MPKQKHPISEKNLKNIPLEDLRAFWAEAWGVKPHRRISRPLLTRSLQFKIREQEGKGFTLEQKCKIDDLVKTYKRDPNIFDGNRTKITAGTRLVREWQGIRHSVVIKEKGFEYQGKLYGSLSEVASLITGTRWNGWVFFGLKKIKKESA